jgi:hypothetical protein
MRIPEKLLFEGQEVANLKEFSFETPWASAYPEFIDDSIPAKLDNLSKFRAYDQDLEEMGLSDVEEETLWENKLSELGLTHSDLKLDKDGSWSVACNDGNINEVRSLSFFNGVLQWRA